MRSYSPHEIAGIIDHTLLRPDAVEDDIRRLCKESVELGFHSVCINPTYIKHARELLSESSVRITTVIGFPLGATLTGVKAYDAIEAVMVGADELDIVINIGLAKAGRWDDLRKEIQSIVIATPGTVHKAIIETGYLTEKEIREASVSVAEGGVEFVKTSTGYGPRGASIRDIEIIRDSVPEDVSIKASGGIATLGDVLAFIRAGAERIGTSSALKIMNEAMGCE
jgi:deoxyribose-phosphate aldolase